MSGQNEVAGWQLARNRQRVRGKRKGAGWIGNSGDGRKDPQSEKRTPSQNKVVQRQQRKNPSSCQAAIN